MINIITKRINIFIKTTCKKKQKMIIYFHINIRIVDLKKTPFGKFFKSFFVW